MHLFLYVHLKKPRASRSVEGLARDPKGETSAWVSHFFYFTKLFFLKNLDQCKLETRDMGGTYHLPYRRLVPRHISSPMS